MDKESIGDIDGTEEGEILDGEDAHNVVIMEDSSTNKRGILSSDDDAPTPRGWLVRSRMNYLTIYCLNTCQRIR